MTDGPAGAGMLKRSVTIAGHRTSVSLEADFWDALRQIAREEGLSVNALVSSIDKDRRTNLSSAIRIFVLRKQQPVRT